MSPFTFFLAFPFFLYLLPFSVQGKNNNSSNPFCPDFECVNLGLFRFPFYSTAPRCGLCKLDCNETIPKIQLSKEDQRQYDLIGKLQNSTIYIRDTVYADQIHSRDCNIFHTLTFPNTSSISYSFLPPLTLFKCDSSPEVTRRTNRHFNSSKFHSYKDCRDFNLYYKYPTDYLDDSDGIPQECIMIQLPHIPVGLVQSGANQSDLFQILASNITLDMFISENCLRCHYHGGQCQDNGRCIHAARKETGNRVVVLATLAVAVAAGIVVLVITFCIIFKSTLAKHMILSWKKAVSYQNIEIFLKNYGSLAPRRYSYLDIKKMTNSFKEKLGHGGYGHVYKGKMCNGNVVAVKVLQESKGNGDDFINEVASISRTSHVNIVNLLRFCFEGHKRALVYEFMPNGSLEKFMLDLLCMN